VLEQNYKNKTGQNIVKTYNSKKIKLDILPDDLKKIVKKSSEMNFSELLAYIRKIEKEGYDASAYKVDLFGRTASPFICIIMILTGAAVGIGHGIKDNFSLGIAKGVGVSFFYWVLFGFCTSLGYGKMLPPFISAWAANFIFFFSSVIYLLNAE
jgi:lipopolysaccharide export system permease protein